MLRGSFVPPPVIRELRDVSRYRKRLVQDRGGETQRVDKVLQDAAVSSLGLLRHRASPAGR